MVQATGGSAVAEAKVEADVIHEDVFVHVSPRRLDCLRRLQQRQEGDLLAEINYYIYIIRLFAKHVIQCWAGNCGWQGQGEEA